MNNEISHITLCHGVEIYKGLLPEAADFAKELSISEKENTGDYYLRKWDQWSIFGTYTQQKHNADEPAIKGPRYDREKYMCDEIYAAYSKAISHYINKYDVKLPHGAALMTSSFSKYNPDVESMGNGLSMQYHTDFILSEKDMPGPKFFLTCTTYLNDDYDGGDIIFYIEGEDHVFPYKPEAGDICVFPSGLPYFHGVKTIRNGEKFFIRNFISYTYDGSKEWLDNQKYYGAYKWGKMEQARIERESESAMRYVDFDENNKVIRVK